MRNPRCATLTRGDASPFFMSTVFGFKSITTIDNFYAIVYIKKKRHISLFLTLFIKDFSYFCLGSKGKG